MTVDTYLERCSFPSGELHVAVSGGADSLALLVLACATGQPVTAHHVDHGLRDGSEKESLLVEESAERFGAAFVSHTVNVVGDRNIEANARAARYGVLPPGVLTGHTADDQAETVLLNLLRGAGVDGMAGMRSEGHPILALRRADTEAICEAHELAPFQDPSNNESTFLRNRIRHELLPLMNDLAARDVAGVLSRQASSFRAAADTLDRMAIGIDPTDAKAVAALPDALASRVVRRWLRSELDVEQHPPDAAAIARVLAVARGEALACDVVNGWRVTRSHQRLHLSR